MSKAVFKAGDIEITRLQNFPRATFTIPRLLTVGPNFRLYGAIDAEMTLAGYLVSKVRIAFWGIQRMYSDQSSGWHPQGLSALDRDSTGSFDGLS